MSVFREALALSIVVLAGCGGSDAADVGSDASTSTSSDGSSVLPTGDGSNSGGGNSAGDDSGTGLPMIGPDGGVIFPVDDAGTGADASRGGGVTTPRGGTDGGADQIACGATPCDSKTQVCCTGGGGGSKCIATGGMCAGSILACSGTNSCASGICCGNLMMRTSTCETTCPMGTVQLCTTNADCSANEECLRARNSEYNVCGPIPMPRDAGTGFPIPDGGFHKPDGG